MLPDIATCLAARSRRDEHFSGVFVVGDGSRFCVSHCPSRLPARSRMTIFASAPAALAAGLEPCARCTPLTAPRIPDWRIENRSVVGALRLIQRGFLRSNSTQALAARLGVSAGELRKHFIAELGVSPSGWSKAQAQHIKSQQQATRGSARTEPLKFVVPLREPFGCGRSCRRLLSKANNYQGQCRALAIGALQQRRTKRCAAARAATSECRAACLMCMPIHR